MGRISGWRESEINKILSTIETYWRYVKKKKKTKYWKICRSNLYVKKRYNDNCYNTIDHRYTWRLWWVRFSENTLCNLILVSLYPAVVKNTLLSCMGLDKDNSDRVEFAGVDRVGISRNNESTDRSNFKNGAYDRLIWFDQVNRSIGDWKLSDSLPHFDVFLVFSRFFKLFIQSCYSCVVYGKKKKFR